MISSHSKGLTPAEEYVRSCIASVLGVAVVAHDDGSRDSMYDLEIRYPDRRPAPVEVTSDINEKAAATLRELGQDDAAWVAPSLGRTWMLQTTRSPNLKKLRQGAEPHLRTLEQAGYEEFDRSEVDALRVQHAIHQSTGPDVLLRAGEQLLGLGVEQGVSFAAEPGEARIAVLPTLGGGSWDGSADAVVTWVEEFAADPKHSDNLRKLSVDGADQAHLAVLAHMAGVPWEVWRALVDDRASGVAPTRRPVLPEPLTHLWLFPAPGGATALAYDPLRGWHRIDTPTSNQEAEES